MTDRRARALDHFGARRTAFLDDLKDLVRIPSVSFPGFDAVPVPQHEQEFLELNVQFSHQLVRVSQQLQTFFFVTIYSIISYV